MPVRPPISAENVVELMEAAIDEAYEEAKKKAKGKPVVELTINLGKFAKVATKDHQVKVLDDYKAVGWAHSRWIEEESMGDTTNTIGCFKFYLRV